MTLTLALVFLISSASSEAPLDIRFIGNAGFELSDGKSTILIDFPYESGAFGYMTFPRSELRRRDGSLCLFTHRHADHFDPNAISAIGCSVAGPAEVQSAVPASLRAGPGPTWTYGDATIRCLTTQHANVEHCSYLIGWRDQHIFVSGDSEDLTILEQINVPLDTLFVPAWLIPEIESTSYPATSTVVIDHYMPDEVIPECRNCIIPPQGAILGTENTPPAPRRGAARRGAHHPSKPTNAD